LAYNVGHVLVHQWLTLLMKTHYGILYGIPDGIDKIQIEKIKRRAAKLITHLKHLPNEERL